MATIADTPGESYDFEVGLPPGDYSLRMRSFNHMNVVLRVR